MIIKKDKKYFFSIQYILFKYIWLWFMSILTIFILYILLLSFFSSDNQKIVSNEKYIITTTTMLNDLVLHLIGDVDLIENKYQKIENVKSFSLMGYGIDPHNYKTKLSDRKKIKKADLVIVNGLHLESKMIDSLKILSEEDNSEKFISASSEINKKDIRIDEETLQEDPHIWFSIDLWQQVLKKIKKSIDNILEEKDKIKLESNFQLYNNDLEELKTYFQKKISELNKKCNTLMLVTAHDAFSYLAYKNNVQFELRSIQGISTQTETSISDINNLANELAQKKVKAIFTESSISHKSLDSLREAVLNKGHNIKISEKELFSDSLGLDDNSFEHFYYNPNKRYKLSSYIGTFLHNIHIIEKELS
ncbi:metal ABC transporter solute-binding protein, Zn/Mn family ['Cynodon dactylon' phytoplasma]|uniref:metal ABC transporter solute-binding protein, Zn/Mn family n=1 Tax='Cynodon dactylon' phytoplasma TaxID=295320 RepID=UPI001265ADC4|nr:zinc ABC transporter substrate-binding protein ['Cynodon dactylon' phytoplasma]KAB8121821.1 zinc ABC transporter substrate-binding protein ['Cynodon dactylon' phytoplasma]